MTESPPAEGDVTALVVLTFDRPHLPRLWDDIARQDYRSLDLIVVDNDSHDGSAEFIQGHAPTCPMRENHRARNLGVTPAWNTALREVTAPWVLLLSPDCRFPPDLTARLVRRALEVRSTLPRGSRLGGVSPGFRWEGRPGASLSLSPDLLPRQTNLVTHQDEGEVFSYHGACALISRELLSVLGGWDERVNFGGDEVDVGLRAHLLGFRFYTVAGLFVEHPFEPRLSGRPGFLRTMRIRSTWFSLLKHAGITLGWGAIPNEAVHLLFWNRLIAFPRDMLANFAWFVSVTPDLSVRRRDLHQLWESTRAGEGSVETPVRT